MPRPFSGEGIETRFTIRKAYEALARDKVILFFDDKDGMASILLQ